MDGSPARAPVYQDDFDDALEAIEPDFLHFDDAFRATEELLCESPSVGVETQNPGVYRFRLRFRGSGGDVIRVSIFYAFDDEQVWFLSIRRQP